MSQTPEFIPLSDPASRSVAGASGRHAALIEDAFKVLIETPGGFDYTGADCMGWLQEAGFRETRVEHLAGAYSMAVGIR